MYRIEVLPDSMGISKLPVLQHSNLFLCSVNLTTHECFSYCLKMVS